MITLIIGGSASGKSEYGESIVEKAPEPRYYIATMEPYDLECVERIRKHQAQRKDKGFFTIESPVDVGKVVVNGGTVLLECMGNLVANEKYRPDKATEDITTKIMRDTKKLEGKCTHLVIVSNDVFHDGCEYPRETMEYLEALGEINRELANQATNVVEVVCGIPIHIKGENL